MGSKSKSKSSTTTNQTDSRQFRLVEQGITGESVGLSAEIRNGNATATSTEGGDVNRGSNVVYGDNQEYGTKTQTRVSGNSNKITNYVTDGGAIKAAENVAGFAIDAISGGAFSVVEQLGGVVSMLAESNATGQQESYAAIEGILEEKQTDGNQDIQKYMIIAIAVMGSALALGMMGKSKK